MAREGLRTLAMVRKRLSTGLYNKFADAYHRVSISVEDRNEAMAAVVSKYLKHDLELLGLTGQGGKLHCTGPNVLPNGYSVAIKDGLVDSHRTRTNRPRIHCIRVIRSAERVRILSSQYIVPDQVRCKFFHSSWGP